MVKVSAVRLGFSILAVAYIGGVSIWGSQTNQLKPLVVSGSRLALTLDGKHAANLVGFEGGEPFGNVVVDHSGRELVSAKRIGGIDHEPIVLRSAVPPDAGLHAWIALVGKPSPKRNGAVMAHDAGGRPIAGKVFRNALISAIHFPALDSSSKVPGFLAVEVLPESSVAGFATATPPAASPAKKAWLPSNFVIQIEGLDCKQIVKVDGFSIKQQISQARSGNDPRSVVHIPGKVEFPNLKIRLAASSAATWEKWFDDFCIKGNNGQDKERSGVLTFMDPTMKNPLFKLNLYNLGIVSLRADPFTLSSSPIRFLAAELYCERIEIAP